MPFVVQKLTSHQYTGSGGQAYAAQFANVAFVSESAGVLTVDVTDAGTSRITVQTNGWLIANYVGNAFQSSLSDVEYQQQYREIA